MAPFLFLILSFLPILLFSQGEGGKALYTPKLATMAPEGSPWMESLHRMNAEVQKLSSGKARYRFFPGGQLGDEIQMVEGTQFGSIECSGISVGALANLLPSMNVLELPFYWESREEVYFVLDRYLREYYDRELKKLGFVLLGWSENGWRHFFTRNKPIRKPADLKGLRMRSQESEVHLSFWRSLGVNPIPMPTTDIYSALERGTIDGGDNTLVLISATGWIEVIQYITLTSHIYQPAVLVCNKKYWDGLPEEIRKSFLTAMRSTEGDMRDRLLKADRELRTEFEKSGKTIIELKPEELKEFVERAKEVQKDKAVRKIIGEDVFQVVEKGKKEYLLSKKQP